MAADKVSSEASAWSWRRELSTLAKISRTDSLLEANHWKSAITMVLEHNQRVPTCYYSRSWALLLCDFSFYGSAAKPWPAEKVILIVMKIKFVNDGVISYKIMECFSYFNKNAELLGENHPANYEKELRRFVNYEFAEEEVWLFHLCICQPKLARQSSSSFSS